MTMSHFAKILNPINDADLGTVCPVERVVIVARADFNTEQDGINFCKDLFNGFGDFVRCSYGASFRNVFPGAGYFWSAEMDAFIPPKPYPSWLFDEEDLRWVAPVDYPDDGLTYFWNENVLNWELENNDV